MTAMMILALMGFAVSLPMFMNGDDDLVDGPETRDDPVEPVEPLNPDDPDDPEDPEEPVATVIDGTDGDDTLDAPNGETLNGLDGNDTLTATASGSVLNGGAGADEIALEAPAGTVNAGEGADTINIDGSIDADAPSTFVANGDAGDDTIIASGIGGTILGGGAEDVITVQGNLDGVFGQAGNDTISSDTADYGGGTLIDGGDGNDVITLTESAGYNTQSLVNGGSGDDTIATQMWRDADGIDVIDVLTGGAGEDVFEMSFASLSADPSDGATLGNIVEITDFNAAEDRLIVDLSSFGVFAAQVDAPNQITFDVVDRTDGSGSDINFTVANADATGPITGTIALSDVTGLQQDDITLIFSGVDNPT